tara:strand:- start:939 stop:1142 length:204 start_codon:yes stop_codon:yes gene_type:complete
MKSSEKFFFKGKKDFYKTETTGDRVHEVTNPYNSETFRGKEWQRGFNKSYFESLKRYEKRNAAKHGR